MNTQLRSHKFLTERILVLDANVLAANDSSFHEDDNIADSSTLLYNIEDGQVGFLSKDDATYNVLVNSTDFTSLNKFSIIQGTGKTAITADKMHKYTEPGFVESMTIDKRFPVWFGSAYVVNDMYNTVKVTGYTGTESLKNYILNINQAGVRLQHQNSMEMKDGFSVPYRSPDYATLGTGAAYAKNDIYTNLAYKANLMSQEVKTVPVLSGNQPYVCFTIGTGSSQSVSVNGTAVTVTCPSLTSIANGTTNTITFMVVRRNGLDLLQKFTVTTALREAIAKGIADSTLTGTNTIRVIDTNTALSLNLIDKILFVALDSKKALVMDTEPAVKTQIFITAPSFSNGNNPITLQPTGSLATGPSISTVSLSMEPMGSGNEWLIKYKNNAKNDVYTAQMYGWTYKTIVIPDYINADVNYNVFVLMHGFEDDNFSPHDEEYYSTTLLVPNLIPLTVTGGGGSGAVLFGVVGSNGSIVSVYVNQTGTGYSSVPTVSVPATYGGTGATFTAVLSSTTVDSVTVTAAGSGYKNIAPIGSAGTRSLNLPTNQLTTYIANTITTANGWKLEGSTVTFA